MQTKSCVVGIAGGTASGKTSLTRTLKQFLGEQPTSPRVDMLSVDAFFHANKTLGPTFVSPTSGEELFNFNHPDAIDQQKLLASIASQVTAEGSPTILLVEGLMVLHIPEVRAMLDVRVFVELEADKRALRRLLRDMKGGRGSTDPEWIATYYLESARVGHDLFIEPSRVHADFIIRGDADFSRLVPLLAAAIESTI